MAEFTCKNCQRSCCGCMGCVPVMSVSGKECCTMCVGHENTAYQQLQDSLRLKAMTAPVRELRPNQCLYKNG